VKNPYSKLINHMRTQGGKNNTPYVQIGVVVSADPLTIKLGDLQIGKENLLVADYLLPSYAREYTAEGNVQFTDSGSLGGTDGAVVGPYGSHDHSVTSINIDTDNAQSGSITLTDGLKVNDIVTLTPLLELEGQMYAVLARMVSP